MKQLIRLAITATIILASLSGCTRSTPARYYVLNPALKTTTNVDSESLLGIRPTGFPQYLQRQQIVQRTDESEIVFDDFHNWGEPLEEAFFNVLAKNLEKELHKSVTISPWRTEKRPQRIVTVEVLRFETSPQGQATLRILLGIDSQQQEKEWIVDFDASKYEAGIDSLAKLLEQAAKDVSLLLQ